MAKVLIVDDNRDLADTIATMLELSGFEVAVAYDGEAALAEIARSSPDAVVLDLALPVVDGITVAVRLREIYGRRLRLLALTARADDDTTRRQVADVGFDDLLMKPASIYQIVNAIRHGGGRATA
jgi:DNA-binding response OmpR family regulator